jgi:hypothetical protein
LGLDEEIALRNVDLPQFGSPMIPTSAIRRSSKRSLQRAPGSPFSAILGVRRVGVANRAFPRPPRPPLATRARAPGEDRSQSGLLVSRSKRIVPAGTFTTRLLPFFPLRLLPCPSPPFPARYSLRCWRSMRVARLRSACKTISPPRPPSPPSGPPLGINFSLRKLMHPFPPDPAMTMMSA